MTDFIINCSLKDRFMVLLGAFILALAGAWSFKNMPIDAIPDLSDVQVIIFTDYADQSPQVVENDMITNEFRVFGLVKKERIYTEKDLLQMKQESIGTVYIKNHKGDIVINAKNMKGVLLKTILDSTVILSTNYKNYNQFFIILTAVDGNKNSYSWNELYNTEIGNHVYLITEKNGKSLNQIPEKLLVLSANDINGGGRYLKNLSTIEIKAVDEIK